MLRDTVWIDETHINDTDLSKGYGQACKRGLSRQKPYVCVANDVHENPVAVVCGRGKPSSTRVRKAMGVRIAPGSPLIHDLERAHGALVKERASSEVHRGGRQRPGLPGADGDGERPVLVAQALPLALHGNVAQEPAGPPRLVRQPLQGQPDPGKMEPDCKGGAPYPDGRRDLPQLGVVRHHP